MPKILVTGGGGYIGSHTVYKLLENGYEVAVIDSFINSNPESLERVKLLCKRNKIVNKDNLKIYKGDLRNEEVLEKIFNDALAQEKPIEGVIHFAGLKSVSESVNNPIKYWELNLGSSLCLMKIMQKFCCNCLVFSSSASIYDSSINKRIAENSKIKPINSYGNTKLAIEILIKDIFLSSKNLWKMANLRYFNPIGAHESGLIGEDPNGDPNNIFPLILRVASKKINKLEIFGNDWPTHDGTGIRDYIHVEDLAEGHIKVLDFLFKNQSQIINLNLGTGLGTSVLELIRTFEKVTNIEIPFTFSPRRTGDLPSIVADNSLAKEILGWNPKKNIADMCKDGWKWQSYNPNGY